MIPGSDFALNRKQNQRKVVDTPLSFKFIMQKYYLIDFDSTFIKTEGLEELANLALKKNPDKQKILNLMKDLTTLGMEGKIPFNESLKQRIKLLKANKQDID